jgi:hypothetical protein
LLEVNKDQLLTNSLAKQCFPAFAAIAYPILNVHCSQSKLPVIASQSPNPASSHRAAVTKLPKSLWQRASLRTFNPQLFGSGWRDNSRALVYNPFVKRGEQFLPLLGVELSCSLVDHR